MMIQQYAYIAKITERINVKSLTAISLMKLTCSATEIKKRGGRIICVIYTLQPESHYLSSNLAIRISLILSAVGFIVESIIRLNVTAD